MTHPYPHLLPPRPHEGEGLPPLSLSGNVEKLARRCEPGQLPILKWIAQKASTHSLPTGPRQQPERQILHYKIASPSPISLHVLLT
jgi:hypothetical protein